MYNQTVVCYFTASLLTQLCSKLSRVIFLLKKLKYLVSERYLITIYHALFHSHLSYGILLWGHSAISSRVLLLQKKALRVITSSGQLDHCRPIFQRLGILTVYAQYIFNSLVFVKVNLTSFGKRQDVHSYNTRRAGDINLPHSRLSRNHCSFPLVAMKLFNNLPNNIKQLDITKFKTTVHSRLISRPIYSVSELEAEPRYWS